MLDGYHYLQGQGNQVVESSHAEYVEDEDFDDSTI
jgi:hypothetical protein